MKTFDIIIVGAGPAGSTCAFYLATQGKRVALLERACFPRDKICGDAVVPRAQVHLRRMSILPRLLHEGKAFANRRGGFVSPGGIEALAGSDSFMESTPVLSIKRRILDEAVARAARDTGAELLEHHTVQRVVRDEARDSWTVETREGESLRARALVAADGSNSRICRSLGLVREHPSAFCSRAYLSGTEPVEGVDGVACYRSDLLPGYSAVFREADGDYNFCCYLMPGSKLTFSDLRKTHQWFLREHPMVRRFIGKNTRIEPMRSGPLRIGGVKKSYLHGFLAVGDAAGHIDPLSGEGIQFAMESAEIAARTLETAFKRDDFRESTLCSYQDGWMKAFGRDFAWSARIARIMTSRPQLLDVSASSALRNGVLFFRTWGEIMTSEIPKSAILRPGVLLPFLTEMLRHRFGGSPFARTELPARP